MVGSSKFKQDIVQYLQTLVTNPNNMYTAEDIIKFTKTVSEEEYPDKDIGKFLWTQEEVIDVGSAKYKAMVEQELYFGGSGGILGAMDEHKVDLFIVPSILRIANDLAAKMDFPIMAIPSRFWPEHTAVQKRGGLVKVAQGIP